jgi:aerobic carbon-monoxide dehydrogenase small subunit
VIGSPPGTGLVLEMTVNGRTVSLEVETSDLLLDVLRDRLGLYGSKRSCDVQVCGACTVLLDGSPVSACTLLAYEARGRHVLTIEGLANGDQLHPLQEAFITESAFQCGYCTPGMILAAKALLDEEPHASRPRIEAHLRGNICRCTGYVNIVRAVETAQRALAKRRGTRRGNP